MRNIFILLYLMVYAHLIAQENFVFSSINSNNGLSDNRVRSICQLPDGRMIFITPGLVNIYDGSDFQYMHFNDQKSYPLESYSGWHRAYVDNESRLWIKNQYKLMVFDIRDEIFIENADSIFAVQGINETISDFFIDTHHNFWYLTDKHNLYYRESGIPLAKLFLSKAIMYDSNCKNLYDIAVYNEQVFLFYKSGLTVCYNLKTHQELYRESISGQNIFEYANTLMVVPYSKYLYQVRNGEKGGLLLRFDVTNHKWERVLATDY